MMYKILGINNLQNVLYNIIDYTLPDDNPNRDRNMYESSMPQRDTTV